MSAAGKLLAWDTEFWGRRIALATVVAPAWGDDHSIDCTFLRLDADRIGDAHAAERAGYRLMDVRLTLERATDWGDRPGRVRECVPEDVAALRAIARSAHLDTRFYADPRFPDARCDELYALWIQNAASGKKPGVSAVLVPDDGSGYVAVRLDGETSSIELIAVAADHRGRGVGHRLVCAARGWAYDQGVGHMTVATQGRNVAAQRLFQRAGFVARSTELWLHRWADAA